MVLHWMKSIITMDLYLSFQITVILVLASALSVNSCQLEVNQPQALIFERENQSVFLPCYINISTCTSNKHEVLWYVFTSDSHHQLDTKNQPLKFQLETQHLQINFLSASDTGVYYCAATLNGLAKSGAQSFGSGTTLMVKEHWQNTSHVVLLALLVFLTLYSLTILTIIICIKTGRGTSFIKGRLRSEMKSDTSRRVHFRAVVQEMYSKRNLRSNKKNSAEVSQENKVENPRSHSKKEDIYQNLNRTGQKTHA